MIHHDRIRLLNDKGLAERSFVLYWMQRSQRAECNHALEYAVRQANLLLKPLVVFFGVTGDFPEANERHYRFMLEGLKETREALEKRNILMVIGNVSPEAGALELSASAALVVTDRGCLRIERAWREALGREASCRVVQVETDAVVPVQTVSSKEEYAAATLRPKIHRLLDTYTVPLHEEEVHFSSLGLSLPFARLDIRDVDAALKLINMDRSVKPVQTRGGTSRAKLLLQDFITSKLPQYPALKNDPGLDVSSGLSPYLHFGQISPLYVALALRDAPVEPREDFLEELLVRRELAMNFALFNNHYDSFDALPAWAKATLDKHRADKRPYQYSPEELENSRTHDPYWNAAQTEMVLSAKMNGYMRMYWGKKLLEWGRTPEEAFRTALFLNNRWSLDGRDPNGFAGIAWCFGKHDRPWKEREIFGMVRYMNAGGLDRKFDMKRYLEKVRRLGSSHLSV